MAATKGNKYALGNTGKPPLYSDPKKLEKKIIEYFDLKQKNDELATVNSLALFLGFRSKTSLYDYAKKEEFAYTVKRALTVIEEAHEQGLWGKNPAGHIFALKNSGWTDGIQTEYVGKVEISSGVILPPNGEE